MWIQVWDRLCVPGGAPPAEISNYTRTPPLFADMVLLQTRTKCPYEIRYDRPSRMCMSVRDSTYYFKELIVWATKTTRGNIGQKKRSVNGKILINYLEIIYLWSFYKHISTLKDELIYMTRAWDKEEIRGLDRNGTLDLLNTGRALYPLSYENSWRARSFRLTHLSLLLPSQNSPSLFTYHYSWWLRQ